MQIYAHDFSDPCICAGIAGKCYLHQLMLVDMKFIGIDSE